MRDERDQGKQTEQGGADGFFRRRNYQCPACNEVLTHSLHDIALHAELFCPSCGRNVETDNLREVEVLSQDQRGDPRYDATLKVFYKSFNDFIMEYTKNVSRQGMFINTRRQHEIGETVDLSLTVPGLSEPLRIHGQVVRVITGAERDDDAGIGIRFVNMDDASRQKLIQYIRSHEESASKRPPERRLG